MGATCTKASAPSTPTSPAAAAAVSPVLPSGRQAAGSTASARSSGGAAGSSVARTSLVLTTAEQATLEQQCKAGHAQAVSQLLQRRANKRARRPTFSVNATSNASDGRTPLFLAAQMGHSQVVAELLAIPDVDCNVAELVSGTTPLHGAVYTGHAMVVAQLVAHPSTDVNATSTKGRTPLYIACTGPSSDASVLSHLLSHPSLLVNAPGDAAGLCTPLWRAAVDNNMAAVAALTRMPGIDTNARGEDGAAPLWHAASHGNLAMAELLLRVPSTDVNTKRTDFYDHGASPLHCAATNGAVEVVKLLCGSPGIDVNADRTVDGTTPLLCAARQGHPDVVGVLLQQPGVDVNLPSLLDGTTPLYWACRNQHNACFRLLLAAPGVDVNTQNLDDGTTTPWCSRINLRNFAALMASPGAHANTIPVTSEGLTPLCWAAREGHTPLVRQLLAMAGVDPNQASHDTRVEEDSGATPLWWAVTSRTPSLEVVRLLLASPTIDPNLGRVRDGASPLYSASVLGATAMVSALLQDERVDVNRPTTDYGATPLFAVAYKGSYHVVLHLAAAPNLNPNLGRTVDGSTPLHAACKKGHVRVVELLLQLPGLDLVCGGKPNGSSPGTQAPQAQSALQVALAAKHMDVVEVLHRHARWQRRRALLLVRVMREDAYEVRQGSHVDDDDGATTAASAATATPPPVTPPRAFMSRRPQRHPHGHLSVVVGSVGSGKPPKVAGSRLHSGGGTTGTRGRLGSAESLTSDSSFADDEAHMESDVAAAHAHARLLTLQGIVSGADVAGFTPMSGAGAGAGAYYTGGGVGGGGGGGSSAGIGGRATPLSMIPVQSGTPTQADGFGELSFQRRGSVSPMESAASPALQLATTPSTPVTVREATVDLDWKE